MKAKIKAKGLLRRTLGHLNRLKLKGWIKLIKDFIIPDQFNEDLVISYIYSTQRGNIEVGVSTGFYLGSPRLTKDQRSALKENLTKYKSEPFMIHSEIRSLGWVMDGDGLFLSLTLFSHHHNKL